VSTQIVGTSTAGCLGGSAVATMKN